MSIRHMSYVARDGLHDTAQAAHRYAHRGWRRFSTPGENAVDLCPPCLKDPPIWRVRQQLEREQTMSGHAGQNQTAGHMTTADPGGPSNAQNGSRLDSTTTNRTQANDHPIQQDQVAALPRRC